MTAHQNVEPPPQTPTSMPPPASHLLPPPTPVLLPLLPQVFVTAHQSVESTSAKMWASLKRRNYVTPTNYLETVRGYKVLLADKRAELGDKSAKLQVGCEGWGGQGERGGAGLQRGRGFRGGGAGGCHGRIGVATCQQRTWGLGHTSGQVRRAVRNRDGAA